MNKKGFILTEAIIVSSVVLTTLVLIYSQFAKINKNYGDSYIYDSINGIYALKQMSSYLQEEDLSKITDNLETFIDISDCNLSYYTHKEYCEKMFLYSNLDLLFVTYNDKDAMYNTLSETNNYGLKLLNYIKSIDDSDDNYSYRLVGVFKDGTYASIPFGKDKYRESLLCGATPILKGGMVPVTIDDDGTVRVADLYSKWYKYKEKRWANAVILSSNKSYSVNEIIPESDIESYFVWIPKYKYQLFDLGLYDSQAETIIKNKEINIKFGLADTNDSNEGECTTPMTAGETVACQVGDYMTHPAFISMDANGFWVAKFESSGSTSSLKVLPNVPSLVDITVGNMFTAAYNYNRNLDSHMIKNTEWGAVAYLSHSIYGINNEIRINNSSDMITGCAGSTANASSSPGCQNAYNTETGYLASTTGNISGIYDMAGGALEYVAGYIKGNTGNANLTVSNYDIKYFDIYTAIANTNYSNRILGDATGEMGPFNTIYMGSWYDDYAGFVSSFSPWFIRGGYSDHASSAGVFYFNVGDGDAYSFLSFRIVLK